MPAFLEKKLKKEYGENSDVPYKVMNKLGYMHGSKETAKGREAEHKHEIHIHGGSTHEVVHMVEPSEVREVDCSQFGKDWEPNTLLENVYSQNPQSQAEDEVEYGRTHQPGERPQR